MMNVLDEGVHEAKNLFMYQVLEQVTMRISLDLNKAADQNSSEGTVRVCSNKHE